MSSAPFRRLLIANRGEIASRIIRTCRRLGVETVAIHATADATARHVREADDACEIAAPSPVHAYLDIDGITVAAREHGCDAVHPGYGFLAENAVFARAVEGAGLAFVGAAPESIERMGDKLAGRAEARAAGIPTVPGSHAPLKDTGEATAAADGVGYPVVMKAAAGGGGIGIAVASDRGALKGALERATTAGSRFFGDGKVYLERFLPAARHIEVQIFGDGHGQVVHLFERDCSVQRRHQKVVEETPATALPPALAERMRAAAVALSRSLGYRGAGTVEMLVSGEDYYFLEMNTRLQVEHPVTEEVTGLDLVEWQLRVAAEEALPMAQHDIEVSGHAIECRVYAEDPERFLPSPGTLLRYHEPTGDGLRVDSGFAAGDEVTRFFDPMLAKVIAVGDDRPDALRRMTDALQAFIVEGVRTNLPALISVISHPDFLAGSYDTTLLEQVRPASAGSDVRKAE